MKTQHTPGPWILKSDPSHYDTLSSIVGGEKNPKGKWFPSHELNIEVGGFADVPTQEANARLIAAAPEMLAELKHLADLLDAHFELGGSIPGLATTTKARQIIAKATGKEWP